MPCLNRFNLCVSYADISPSGEVGHPVNHSRPEHFTSLRFPKMINLAGAIM